MKKYLLLAASIFLVIFSCRKSESTHTSETKQKLAKLVADVPKSIHIDGTNHTITIIKANGEKQVVKDLYSSPSLKAIPTVGGNSQFNLRLNSYIPLGSSIKQPSKTVTGTTRPIVTDDGSENSLSSTTGSGGIVETIWSATASKVNGLYTGACCYICQIFPTQGEYIDEYGETVFYNITVSSVTGSFVINGAGTAIHIYWSAVRTISYTTNGETTFAQTDISNDAWF